MQLTLEQMQSMIDLESNKRKMLSESRRTVSENKEAAISAALEAIADWAVELQEQLDVIHSDEALAAVSDDVFIALDKIENVVARMNGFKDTRWAR